MTITGMTGAYGPAVALIVVAVLGVGCRGDGVPRCALRLSVADGASGAESNAQRSVMTFEYAPFALVAQWGAAPDGTAACGAARVCLRLVETTDGNDVDTTVFRPQLLGALCGALKQDGSATFPELFVTYVTPEGRPAMVEAVATGVASPDEGDIGGGEEWSVTSNAVAITATRYTHPENKVISLAQFKEFRAASAAMRAERTQLFSIAPESAHSPPEPLSVRLWSEAGCASLFLYDGLPYDPPAVHAPPVASLVANGAGGDAGPTRVHSDETPYEVKSFVWDRPSATAAYIAVLVNGQPCKLSLTAGYGDAAVWAATQAAAASSQPNHTSTDWAGLLEVLLDILGALAA